MNETAARIVELATARGVTIAVAESLTGGMLSAALVEVPGASAALRGGFVTYATELKASVLGVDGELLRREGPVDAEVAAQMAHGARWVAAVDGEPASLGIATTGVAGPDPQDGKPVGLVYFGFARSRDGEDEAGSMMHRFSGTRAEIRAAATQAALELLLEMVADPAFPELLAET